jgi:hypothetical protein
MKYRNVNTKLLIDIFYSRFDILQGAAHVMQIFWFQVSLKYLSSGNANSAFYAANLPAALDLVETWERRLSLSSTEASEIIG